MDGLPNNLTDTGSELFERFIGAGAQPTAILFYLAGIWKSDLAAELLEKVGSAVRPGIRMPSNAREVEIALEIAEAAKIARDYVYVSQHLVLGEEEFQSI
jgi:hypothetical protein